MKKNRANDYPQPNEPRIQPRRVDMSGSNERDRQAVFNTPTISASSNDPYYQALGQQNLTGQTVAERPLTYQQQQNHIANIAKQQKIQRNRMSKRRSKVRKWPFFLMATIIVLLSSFIGLWLYIFSEARTSLKPLDFLRTNETVAEDVKEEDFVVPYDEEVTHILLIGVDSRKPGELNTNSDTMIVVTLDQKRQQIRLTSFQRDMLLKIEGREGFYKLNSAMFDGPYTLMKTLNKNFKLDISKYVIVDFLGAERVVDLLGGVEVHVPEAEDQVAYLNSVIWDTNVEMGGDPWVAPLDKGGLQKLNGRQALAFARIRKLDSDFNRMERQQELIRELFKRFKAANAITKIQAIKESLGLIATNMSDLELLGIATSALPKISKPIESISVPLYGYYQPAVIGGVAYIVPSINAQLPLVHEFLYQEDHSAGPAVEEYPYYTNPVVTTQPSVENNVWGETDSFGSHSAGNDNTTGLPLANPPDSENETENVWGDFSDGGGNTSNGSANDTPAPIDTSDFGTGSNSDDGGEFAQ